MRRELSPPLGLLAAVAVILAVGTAGYVLIEGMDPLEALYVASAMILTIGSREPGEPAAMSRAGTVFTVLLIWCGVGAALFFLTRFVGYVVGGELDRFVRARRMLKAIGRLEGHFIICGAGIAARRAYDELKSGGRDVVVVDKDPEALARLRADDPDLLFVEGDATEADVLEKAGAARCAGVITALPTDAENLYVVLIARDLNADALVIAEATSASAAGKIRRVGADHVITPAVICGTRMASAALRPTALAFLDVVTQSGEETLRLEEVEIPEGSRWAGKRLGDVRIPQRADLLVMGLKGPAGAFSFNPSGSTELRSGDKLVVVGTGEQREGLVEILSENA